MGQPRGFIFDPIKNAIAALMAGLDSKANINGDNISAAAFLTALGGTAAGVAVFTAADADAQLTALGGTSAGKALFTAADADAQITALGGTAAGSAIFKATNADAQLNALGASTAGKTLFTAVDEAAQRGALQVPLILSEEGSTAEARALEAYQAGYAFLYNGATDITIPLDFSSATTDDERSDIFKAACDWHGKCIVTGYGKVKFTPPEGLTTFAADQAKTISRRAGQPSLFLEPSASPTYINITGVTITNVSGTLYEIELDLADPLPARVVTDYAIGLCWMAGDNDMNRLSGACQVIDIALDRLSFTYRQRFVGSAPVAPTTISHTASTVSGILQSRIVIPFACFGWPGGTGQIESFINIFEGGSVYSRSMGYSWTGSDATTDGSVIGVHRPGAWWYSLADDVFVGGPTKIIRSSFGGSIYLNRSYLGGNDYVPAFNCISTQGGGALYAIRCCLGGARTGPITIGQATQFYIAQCTLVCNQYYALNVLGGIGMCYPSLIVGMPSGGLGGAIDVQQGGSIVVTSATQIVNCTLGLNWAGGSTISGAPTFSGCTADAADVGNTLSSKGWWVKDSTLPLAFAGSTGSFSGNITVGGTIASVGNISITNSSPEITFTDGSVTCRLDGNSGNGIIRAHNTSRHPGFGYPGVDKYVFANSTSLDPVANNTATFAIASNTEMVIKVRGSDGVVRSNTLTLA